MIAVPAMAARVTCTIGMASLNSLTPGTGGNNFEIIIFELIYWIDILRNSYEIVLWRMPKHQIHDKSTLVQVFAWCWQATSHYLRQCWPSSLSPYSITRPQWVKEIPVQQWPIMIDTLGTGWCFFFSFQIYDFLLHYGDLYLEHFLPKCTEKNLQTSLWQIDADTQNGCNITFSYSCSSTCKKIVVFSFKFHWSCSQYLR